MTEKNQRMHQNIVEKFGNHGSHAGRFRGKSHRMITARSTNSSSFSPTRAGDSSATATPTPTTATTTGTMAISGQDSQQGIGNNLSIGLPEGGGLRLRDIHSAPVVLKNEDHHDNISSTHIHTQIDHSMDRKYDHVNQLDVTNLSTILSSETPILDETETADERDRANTTDKDLTTSVFLTVNHDRSNDDDRSPQLTQSETPAATLSLANASRQKDAFRKVSAPGLLFSQVEMEEEGTSLPKRTGSVMLYNSTFGQLNEADDEVPKKREIRTQTIAGASPQLEMLSGNSATTTPLPADPHSPYQHGKAFRIKSRRNIAKRTIESRDLSRDRNMDLNNNNTALSSPPLLSIDPEPEIHTRESGYSIAISPKNGKKSVIDKPTPLSLNETTEGSGMINTGSPRQSRANEPVYNNVDESSGMKFTKLKGGDTTEIPKIESLEPHHTTTTSSSNTLSPAQVLDKRQSFLESLRQRVSKMGLFNSELKQTATPPPMSNHGDLESFAGSAKSLPALRERVTSVRKSRTPTHHDHHSMHMSEALRKSSDGSISSPSEFMRAEVTAARFGPLHNRDTQAEFEIEVVSGSSQWVVYREYRHFQEFDRTLKQHTKDTTSRKPLLPFPPMAGRKSETDTILELKTALNKHIQALMDDPEFRDHDDTKAFLGYFDGEDTHKHKYTSELKVKTDEWVLGDTSLVFDEAHLLEIRFSVQNIPASCKKGCCLRIYEPNERSQGARYHACLPRRRLLLQSEFVLDADNPRFQKVLLYDYLPMNFSVLEVDLCSDEHSDEMPVGTAVFELAHVMCERTGHMATLLGQARASRRGSLPELRKTLPDSEEIAKTTITITVRRFASLESHTRHYTRPQKTLPSNLRCELWTSEVQNNLKSIFSAHSNLRVNVVAKADKLTMEYFIYKDKEQKYEMCELLLDIWRRVLDEVETMIVHDIKSQVMGKMCEIIFGIMTRYEWDLTHIKHWTYQEQYQPMTTQVWNKRMHRYHKQLEHTVRKVLEWIDEEKELDSTRHQFAVNVLGLASVKIQQLHKQIMTCVLKEWEKQMNLAKLERYEFLIKYFSEDGKAQMCWQQEYELESAQGQERVHSLELYFGQENPSCFMDAWKCFTSDHVDKLLINTPRQREFLQNNAQELICSMYRQLAKHFHGTVNWITVPGFTRVSKIYVQGLIWPRVGTDLSKRVIAAISQLFESVPRTANQLGVFCSALLCNTDALQPQQVQLSFDTIREWIGILERDKYEPLNGLLPDSWCHETFIDAINKILHQDDYQIICVVLTFILHHAHLFQDGLRLSVIRDILIKENFRPLFCHWNAIVRKYFHWVILYTTNRVGFYEDDLSANAPENTPQVVEYAKKLRITFNHIYQVVNKNVANRSMQPNIVSKFPVPKKEKKTLTEKKEDTTEAQHNNNNNKKSHNNDTKKDAKLIWRYTDMNVRQRLETDHDILTTLAIEVINLSKHRDTVPQQYQHYIKPAFCEFLEACNEYKSTQLSKSPRRLGEVGIPTLGYRVLTKQDLDQKDKIS